MILRGNQSKVPTVPTQNSRTSAGGDVCHRTTSNFNQTEAIEFQLKYLKLKTKSDKLETFSYKISHNCQNKTKEKGR
jgi:hypothetical protein